MLEDVRERQLVQRAREGDEGAFGELFEALRERLLATIGCRLGPESRRAAEPEDVLQDTFIRARHSIGRFEWQGTHSFRRWLESIATHVALDVVKRQGRRKALQIQRDVPGADVAPSRALRREERFQRLERSMAELANDYRTVLQLCRIDGLSVKEAATRMGRSESAVKNLLLRATRQLRRVFGETESLNLGDRHLRGSEGADDR
jgi:RNA polymerase sigma-70 factor (ECF subfamily)